MSEIATLGGGCYWCLEAFYLRIKGVEKVVSGYNGGHVTNPSAEDVYRGDTGHAEVVQITFDPKIISYREILEIFFVMHDPTTLNRQGNDVGEWYRSVIFYASDSQRETASDMIHNFAANLYKNPIVTALAPLAQFSLPRNICRITTPRIRAPATAWPSSIQKSKNSAKNSPANI